MQLGKDLRREDILAKDTIVLFLTLLVADTQELLGITGLWLLVHHRDIEDGPILVLPDTRENAIMTDIRQGNRMDTDHQTIVTLILLYQLQGTGFVG